MTTTPNTALMQRYGTESVFREKTAGAASLLERLAGGLAGGLLGKNNQDAAAKQKMQAEMMNEMLRELELARIDQAGQLLRHTPVPRFASSYVPPGWDEGMVRMASAAAKVGADMAKEGGLGGFADFMKSMAPALKGMGQKAMGAMGSLGGAAAIAAPTAGAATGSALGGIASKLKGNLGLGWKGNLALAGAAAGGLYAGNKALQKGTQAMGTEAGPATYGAGSHGSQLPMGVNQYGQPQLGTPL